MGKQTAFNRLYRKINETDCRVQCNDSNEIFLFVYLCKMQYKYVHGIPERGLALQIFTMAMAIAKIEIDIALKRFNDAYNDV